MYLAAMVFDEDVILSGAAFYCLRTMQPEQVQHGIRLWSASGAGIRTLPDISSERVGDARQICPLRRKRSGPDVWVRSRLSSQAIGRQRRPSRASSRSASAGPSLPAL
jgi:hypothetical protein